MIYDIVISPAATRDHGVLLAQDDHSPIHDFQVVSFDTFGVPQPLLPGLGNLPLYFDDDGFYSVNGPLGLRAHPPCAVVTPVNHDANSTIGAFMISDKKPSISPNLPQNHLNDNAVNRFVISL